MGSSGNKKKGMGRLSMAAMAGARAKIYGLLVEVFSQLPDQAFLAKIKGNNLRNLLNTLSDMGSAKFRSGLDYIHAYQSLIKNRPDEEILTELSVDRTRILRGTGHQGLKPPYEGLYKGDQVVGESLLEVKRFYRDAGILPDDSVHEAEDFLCVELDFMKQLCLRERDQWKSDGEASVTVATEDKFLREHLGSWAGQFCKRVEKHALTDFYRGFALILEAVVLTDIQYLHELVNSVEDESVIFSGPI